jgi:hypothetical protein
MEPSFAEIAPLPSIMKVGARLAVDKEPRFMIGAD